MTRSKLIPDTPAASEYNSEGISPLVPDTAEPLPLFEQWLAEARKYEINDSNAMALATVDADGLPDVRMVLLKDVSEAGFTFYTHETSAKGKQLLAQPKAALLFHWKSLRRQVRVRGSVVAGTDAEADAYFASRARESRIGAWASDQSRPLESPEILKTKLAEMEKRFGPDGDVPRPPHWRGFQLVPETIEFWQDQPFRLHDRVRFGRDGDGWTRGRLNP
jgi:pyridoxamine 5'-phosphate oxidase